MSKIEVNTVDVQCGSTLTLGSSGKTVQLATGASQSGFGRTGTVDWETTKKTASFTAANGEGYFVDSSSSAITVTLPASPSAGNIVSISDYNGSAATNSITIGRNGSNINDANGEDQQNVLKKYTIDVTQKALDGKLDPVIGREEEIRRTIQVLSRRTKNNPVLIGEPGVGKTAIIEGAIIFTFFLYIKNPIAIATNI